MKNSFEAIMRALDQASDEEIIRLANKSEDNAIVTPTVVACRYLGTQKLPPGAPFGLARNANGTYGIEHIAIVRVPQEGHLRQAEEIIKKSTAKSIGIGSASGVVAALLTILTWSHLATPPSVPASPCAVDKIQAIGVVCRDGAHETVVPIGQKFPEGRYLLVSVSPGLDGFTATQLSGKRNITFQLDATRHN